MFRFKELIELWRTANSLTQALDDSHEMLERTRTMFEYSVKSLRQSDNAAMDVDIRKMDEAINRYERRVVCFTPSFGHSGQRRGTSGYDPERPQEMFSPNVRKR